MSSISGDISRRNSSGGNAPAEFGAYIKSELAKWGKVVKTSGATAQ